MDHPLRKKSYIDTEVQGDLARRLVVQWLMFTMIILALAFSMQVFSNPLRTIREHAQEVWWVHSSFFLVLIALIPIYVRSTIKLSHRFTGPIHQLRGAIQSITEGKPTARLKFRNSDYWQELAEEFNTMVEQLRQGTDHAKESAQKMDDLDDVPVGIGAEPTLADSYNSLT